MKNIIFYALAGLFFITATVNAGEPYIPQHQQKPQVESAPMTDAELNVAIPEVLKEIDVKLARIDGKIQEIQMLMNRIDSAIANRKTDILCQAFAFSAKDIQAVEEKLHSVTDANERKRAEDRLNLLKTVYDDQKKVLEEKKVSCANQ
ncbi:MAG: hypothetical protein BWK73_33265 [Thiothrix lacustris]|uniref:Periplasmic heavy metal sensor n=1 Tax=Thiothrix lacustris TaxID=525917 RepID=A0A1Y1QH91_9GAMM|nr:MAG: hypothetical protein BWK73_33265 [Thiothrix lacustris]